MNLARALIAVALLAWACAAPAQIRILDRKLIAPPPNKNLTPLTRPATVAAPSTALQPVAAARTGAAADLRLRRSAARAATPRHAAELGRHADRRRAAAAAPGGAGRDRRHQGRRIGRAGGSGGGVGEPAGRAAGAAAGAGARPGDQAPRGAWPSRAGDQRIPRTAGHERASRAGAAAPSDAPDLERRQPSLLAGSGTRRVRREARRLDGRGARLRRRRDPRHGRHRGRPRASGVQGRARDAAFVPAGRHRSRVRRARHRGRVAAGRRRWLRPAPRRETVRGGGVPQAR